MINATIAARGAPFDFDRWAAMGNKGWAWADLLPLFIAIENDVNFGDQPIHGRDGPIVIQRYRPESWAPVNRAMYDACVELGVREAPDLNAPGRTGRRRRRRCRTTATRKCASARSSPTSAAPERRPNLTIRAGCLSIAFFSQAPAPTASPISTAAASRRRRLADQIVISAGVYNSPAILQRSGIGPAEWLRRSASMSSRDLPVGRNLTRSSGLSACCSTRTGSASPPAGSSPPMCAGRRTQAGEPEWQTHPFPVDEEEDIAGFWTYLTRQEAQGEVRIQSCEPDARRR